MRDVLQFLYPAATLPPAPPARAVSIAVQKKEDGAADVVETFAMGPCRMPRLLNGLWQLSSPAWGSGSADSQERALAQLVEAGLSAADMADHYVRFPSFSLCRLWPPRLILSVYRAMQS